MGEQAQEGEETQRLIRLFSDPGNGSSTTSGLALGYEITPINLATRQPLAKAQLLTGEQHRGAGPKAVAARHLLLA